MGIGEPIRIGALLDLDRLTGTDSLDAIRLAIDYLDGSFDGVDGKILGHRVVLLEQNEGCNRDRARVATNELMGDPGLVGVIGTTCSSSALGIADRTFSEARIPLISPTNTAPSLTSPTQHQRFYFRTAWNDLVQAAVVANFAASRQWSEITVVVAPDDAYSKQLGDAFVQSARRLRTTARTVTLAPGQDPADVAAALEGLPPQMVFVTAQPPMCVDVVRALRTAPALQDSAVVVSEACADADLVARLGTLSTGVFGATPDFSSYSENLFYRTTFLDAYRRRVGSDPPTPFHTQAFDAAQLLFDAIRGSATGSEGGELVIRRNDLRNLLLRVEDYPGLSGTLTCAQSGDCTEGVRIAIYEAPGWPTVSQTNPTKVFSQSLTLAELERSD